MSFLIDPPWLYANGRAIGALSEDDRATAALGTATLAVFWGVSVPLYLDRPWTRPLMRVFPGGSGREFMVNSGVFRFDPRGAPALHALIFATYPLWLWLGIRHARR